jgi:hypothetical protein
MQTSVITQAEKLLALTEEWNHKVLKLNCFIHLLDDASIKEVQGRKGMWLMSELNFA